MNWVSIGAITNPFPNFNSATIEVWKWISNFIPHFAGHVITYYCDYLIKGVTGQNIIFNKPILPKITYLKAFHAEVFWRNIKIYLHHTPMLSLHRLSKSFHISDKDQFFLHFHAMPPDDLVMNAWPQDIRCIIGLGVGLLSQFSPFHYFPNFSILSKHMLSIEGHVYI